jgi:branched-chain amino acid aminotransferase
VTYVNLNGKLQEADSLVVPADHRGLRYGYSLFETMRWEEGGLPLGTLHWERLFAGLRTLLLDIPPHFTPAYLEEQVARTVKRNGLEACARIRLQAGPGSGGLYDREGWGLHFLIECFPLAPRAINENGLVVGISQYARKDYSPLSHLKSGSALCYGVAAREAVANRWNDALLLNSQGRIVESTISNLFWVEDAGVFTPPITEGPIAGVCRSHIMASLALVGMPVTEAPLSLETAERALGLFLTNAVRGIQWVKEVGGMVYAKGPVENIGRNITSPMR